jgi:hypothetical protein
LSRWGISEELRGQKVTKKSGRKGRLHPAEMFEPRRQLGYLFSIDSELFAAIETMHVVYVLEPTQRHPEHCATFWISAFERYFSFVHNTLIIRNV